MKNYSNIPARKHFLLNITTVLTVAALTACQPASPSYESGMQKNSAAKKDLALDGAAEKPIPAEAPAVVAYSPAAVYDVQETAPHVTNTERYQKQPDQPVKAVAQEPVSTFSIDVDTGSYANVRRFLNNGRLPPKDAVRIEEIVNYFPYNYPLPTGGYPFAVHTQTVDSPWQPEAKLIKIGIQAQDLAKKELPPANLVFLVDVSGSMDEPDKLPLVKKPCAS